MKDQFSLNYVKDGAVYPIALTEQQNEVLQPALLQMALAAEESLKVIKDKPIGEAIYISNQTKP